MAKRIHDKGAGKRQRNQVTQAEFYRICNALTENKNWFLNNRPTHLDAASKLKELTGIEVSKSTVAAAKEATEIRWMSNYRSAHGGRKAVSRGVRVLAKAVLNLYQLAKQEVPEDLKKLCELVDRLDTEEGASSSDDFPKTSIRVVG